MKKCLTTVLTILTAICFTIGLAGCRDKNTIICKKDFGKPSSASVSEGYGDSFKSFIIEQGEEQLEGIYAFFKSVKYSYAETLSEEEIDMRKKLRVTFSFDNPPILKRTEIPMYSSDSGHTMFCYVDESGKSLITYVHKNYISEEGAVDYNALIEYYNNNLRGD